ncbi:ABC-type transport system involved in cytochrome c biogenesis, permease component [Saccharomonospora glauca K62]|uniref:ABC-type transport system involved in cytochrome c biogenesis, permease component n=2 Tax=Saccharomonospora TaxID=1851 RepID=I1D4G5_9PSEU|nr:heme exporter protein CcmB [Saccharomonospora azurea]EHY87457.1 ABC-type transport system involved in cytochrome c biogenesis, permease component [Saccharomonospora azurea NA-128]EIE99839.1 ABC-type transport system involved in cytochrome c biogenesis, permease component [Saccharomonospora glauca K62]
MSADTTPGALRQCLELARKDLRQELRAGEALLVTAPFGAAGLLLVPLAIGSDVPLLRQIGPGLYWVVMLLFGVLVTLRQSAVDGPAQLAMVRLFGVHPAVRLAGRAAANTVLLLIFEALLIPVAVILYDPDLSGWVWLLPVFPLVAVGLALLGTLANALAQGLASRTALGPLLVVPVSLPLLLGATQVLEAARYGHQPWSWLLLILTVDLAVAVALGLVSRHLEEAA